MAVIYAIPGFGCTSLLFDKIEIGAHTLKVLDWPTPQREYSLKDYAEKFIIQIDTSKPYYLMGVSFGGMLCIELGEILSPEKVILISSAKSANELPGSIKILRVLPFHRILGERILKIFALWSRPFIGFSKELKPLFKQMINSMSPGYFKYCLHYMVWWDRQIVKNSIYQLHGSADLLIPIKRIKQPSYIIKDGSHAIIVHNAREINEVLHKIMP